MRTVLALLCGVTLLAAAGCAIQGGVEVEGGASQVSPPPSLPTTPSGTPVSADPIAILREDPLVNPQIKAALVPCADGAYPIDDRYLDLTHDGKAELVLTLLQCLPDEKAAPEVYAKESGIRRSTGYALFVYNLANEPPTQLLAVEDPAIEAVQSKVNSDQLVVIRNKWLAEDDPCCPTDQDVSSYQWDGTKFIEVR
jgi:hypothetical protein